MIDLLTQVQVSGALLLAMVLSGLIGMDRERRDKPAGLRTHIFVGVGACLFTILSRLAFASGDPTRIAANIVTGVGFLGAGVIVERRNRARGLTTAASIWITSAVGMAVGVGAWFLAIVATLLSWFTLVILHRIEKMVWEHNVNTNQKSQEADNAGTAACDRNAGQLDA